MSIDLVRASSQYLNCGSDPSIDDVNPRSVAAWINLDLLGGDNFYTLATKSNPAPGNQEGWQISFYKDGVFNGMYVWERFDGGNGRWTNNVASAGTMVSGADIHIGVTYDSGNVANNPIFYLNGVFLP